MSAEEQEARIKELESRLNNFDNPDAFVAQSKLSGISHCLAWLTNWACVFLAPIAGGDSDSSDDDDESSGSESEEE